MFPAWGSVVGEKGRSGSPWRHQYINISLVYSIVLGVSIWLWNPIPMEECLFRVLRYKKCKHIYLFRGISDAHLQEHGRCRAAGNEQHLLISLPDVKGFMQYSSRWSIWYLLWDHFHLLSYAEVTHRPQTFEIDCKEILLEPKIYVIAKDIVPKHLRTNFCRKNVTWFLHWM